MPHQNVYKSYNSIKTLMPIDHLQLINLNPHFFVQNDLKLINLMTFIYSSQKNH